MARQVMGINVRQNGALVKFPLLHIFLERFISRSSWDSLRLLGLSETDSDSYVRGESHIVKMTNIHHEGHEEEQGKQKPQVVGIYS